MHTCNMKMRSTVCS